MKNLTKAQQTAINNIKELPADYPNFMLMSWGGGWNQFTCQRIDPRTVKKLLSMGIIKIIDGSQHSQIVLADEKKMTLFYKGKELSIGDIIKINGHERTITNITEHDDPVLGNITYLELDNTIGNYNPAMQAYYGGDIIEVNIGKQG